MEPQGLRSIRMSDVPIVDPTTRKSWGPWKRQGRVIIHRRYRYPIHLDQCDSSAQVLDRICQVAQKTWADDECLSNLVRALNDSLRPQSNLCPCGAEKGVIRNAR